MARALYREKGASERRTQVPICLARIYWVASYDYSLHIYIEYELIRVVSRDVGCEYYAVSHV